MPTVDPRVDEYIAKAKPFARPLLKRIRAAFHAGCPELVETMKWSAPHFTHHGILGSMAAFQEHVTLGFWRGVAVGDPDGILDEVGDTLMSAARFRAPRDLPAKAVLSRYVKRAAKLNADGAAQPDAARAGRAARPRRPAPPTPPDLAAALDRDAAARRVYQAFSPTERREYVEWITGAKREATRARRLHQAIAWMAEGKPRNWKYRKQQGKKVSGTDSRIGS